MPVVGGIQRADILTNMEKKIEQQMEGRTGGWKEKGWMCNLENHCDNLRLLQVTVR